MGYIEDNLMDDETVVLNCRLHPIVLFPPAMSTSFLAGSLWFYSQAFLADNVLVFFAIAILLAYSFYRLLDRVILFLTSEFAITTKRVLGKTGFITRKSLDIVLAKVEAIRLTQSISGRLLDFGNIEVTGTGGTEEILTYIPAPLEFRKAIQEQLSLAEQDGPAEKTLHD